MKKRISLYPACVIILSLILSACSPSTPATFGSQNNIEVEITALNPDFELSDPNNDGVLKVLFLGNSLTFNNDMPAMAEFMANTEEHRAIFDYSLAEGGSFIADFVNNPKVTEYIDNDNWDYVVLQENSNILRNEKKFYKAVHKFKDEVLKDKAKLVFYLHSNGFKSGKLNKASQDAVNRIYEKAAIETGAIIIPVGPALLSVYEDNTYSFEYFDDPIHLSVAGAYIAASTICFTFYGEINNQAIFIGGMDEDIAKWMQEKAMKSVKGHPLSGRYENIE